ncbi:MAG: VOC family protein [Candidatus Latescibacteria bacterium]|nr:VOC family protein [Candidatus Latescibacterota bacterium]
MNTLDQGFTHIAIPVSNIDASLAFYRKYAQMRPVHRREGAPGKEVAWITDGTRPFVIVLIGGNEVPHPFSWPAHIGIAVSSREEVDRLAAEAKREGCLEGGPEQRSEVVGYIAWLHDPDGHTVEVSYGQKVAFTVEGEPHAQQ